MSSQATQRASVDFSMFDDSPPVSAGGEFYTAPAQKPLGNVIPFPTPALEIEAPSVFQERWYQTNALAEIARRLPLNGARKLGKGELLTCPTGGGKTAIASRAIGKWLEAGKRVLVLVDLERLLDQMRDDLMEQEIYPLIEKAEHSALSAFRRHGNCVLASMQTLHEKRLEKWARDSFDYIVIDEAHCFGYEKILAFFSQAQYLGLTATPLRADGRSLKEFFHFPYIKTLSMRQGIEGWNANTNSYENPFLSRIEVLTVDASHIDLSGIKMVGRDFDARELDKRIWEHVNWLASAILEATPGLRTWIYCPKTLTADAVAKALRDMGAGAVAYHSKIADPRATLGQFINDEVQYLTNVNMLIKGINVPKVEAIVRLRASLNIAQATQEIGRGTRLSPQTGKKSCLVVEFGFKTGGKKLVGVLDSILDGDDDEDEPVAPEESAYRFKVKERIEKLMKSGEKTDVLWAEKQAKEQISHEEAETRRKREEARLAKHERVNTGIDLKAKYDPFAGLDKMGAQTSETARAVPASPEQMAHLEFLSGGVIKATSGKHWTHAAAEKRAATLQWRLDHKMASEKQVRMMTETLGLPQKQAHRMKKWDASAWINNRSLEMAGELDGKCSVPFQQLKEMKPWELAGLHKRICGGASA